MCIPNTYAYLNPTSLSHPYLKALSTLPFIGLSSYLSHPTTAFAVRGNIAINCEVNVMYEVDTYETVSSGDWLDLILGR